MGKKRQRKLFDKVYPKKGKGKPNKVAKSNERREKSSDRENFKDFPPNLFETDVSITEYINTEPGFLGTIKSRFSDFQVNEIDSDGNEVRLTNLTQPNPPKIGISDKIEQRDDQWLWPHEYTYFMLYKMNVDTLKAASDLARKLNTDASKFSYAGTKDKRGKTTQWFCVKKTQPERLLNAAKSIPIIKIGNFTFKSEPLKLGKLQGNRFRIAIRNVTVESPNNNNIDYNYDRNATDDNDDVDDDDDDDEEEMSGTQEFYLLFLMPIGLIILPIILWCSYIYAFEAYDK